MEKVEKFCARYEPKETLKLKKANDHEFGILFEKGTYSVTVRVNFDVNACTISYVLDSTNAYFLSAAGKTKGQFYPQVIGNRVPLF